MRETSNSDKALLTLKTFLAKYPLIIYYMVATVFSSFKCDYTLLCIDLLLDLGARERTELYVDSFT